MKSGLCAVVGEADSPPHSIEAEMALIGSMILDSNVIGAVIKLVRPEMFYREARRWRSSGTMDAV